jgi:hypothetical protein
MRSELFVKNAIGAVVPVLSAKPPVRPEEAERRAVAGQTL